MLAAGNTGGTTLTSTAITRERQVLLMILTIYSRV